MQETWVRSLDQEDPLEKEMVTRSRILTWEIWWSEGPGELHTVHGIVKESGMTERLNGNNSKDCRLEKQRAGSCRGKGTEAGWAALLDSRVMLRWETQRGHTSTVPPLYTRHDEGVVFFWSNACNVTASLHFSGC